MFQACWRVCCLSLISGGMIPAAFAGDGPMNPAEELSVQRTSRGWKRVESANFSCWSQLPDEEARQLAESCEVWRTRLRSLWISNPEEVVWTPKCDVVVHPRREDYNLALSRAGDMSVGSTRMNFDRGRVVMRRIDVRADAGDWSNAALPHELTHVVLGERFGGRPLPRWADEGIAMLSESVEKHAERLKNLHGLLQSRMTMPLRDLVQARGVPQPQWRDAFYGQSLALSSLLIRKSTPAQFADFVDDASRIGFDAALEQHYQLRGLSALEQEWKDWTKRPTEVSFVSLPVQTPPMLDVTTAVTP